MSQAVLGRGRRRPAAVLTDTHAHLCDPAFEADLPAVLERARVAGVGTVVAVAETLADSERNLELARAFPGVVRAAAGLFPTWLDLPAARALAAWIGDHRQDLVAIGEVGIDHWKVQDPAGREVQGEIFRLFIDLAAELDLPLNVHSRAAGAAATQMLLARGARRVQLHAFDGRPGRALPAAEAGYFFSVPPSVVRSAQKRRLVAALPLSCLLVETDSPVLGPDPAARNEPAHAIVSLRAVAEIKGLAVAAVAEAVAENTRRLYGA